MCFSAVLKATPPLPLNRKRPRAQTVFICEESDNIWVGRALAASKVQK